MPRIALSDRLLFIIADIKTRPTEDFHDFAPLFREPVFFHQRQDRCLEGCKFRMKLEYNARLIIALVVDAFFLVVGIQKETQNASSQARCRLYHVRCISPSRFAGLGIWFVLIKITKFNAGCLGMLTQVVIGAGCDALELAHPQG